MPTLISDLRAERADFLKQRNEARAELEALREAVRKSYHPQEACDDCNWRGTHDEITAGGKGNDHCPQCHKDGTMTTHYHSCPWCLSGVQEEHIPDSIIALLYPKGTP